MRALRNLTAAGVALVLASGCDTAPTPTSPSASAPPPAFDLTNGPADPGNSHVMRFRDGYFFAGIDPERDLHSVNDLGVEDPAEGVGNTLAASRTVGHMAFGELDRVELHGCRLFRQFYLTSKEAAEALMPDGYTAHDPDEDGIIGVLTDITNCEGFTAGDRRGSAGAIHHEVIRAVKPDGTLLSGGFGFPATFTNPHLRKAFREIGIPGRPAPRLEVGFDASGGSTVVDNLAPFGPDYARSFEAAFQDGTVSGGPFVQHHEYENGVIRKMAWSFPGEQTVVGGPATPLEITGEFTLPFLGAFPVVDGVSLAFGTPEAADWVVTSVDR